MSQLVFLFPCDDFNKFNQMLSVDFSAISFCIPGDHFTDIKNWINCHSRC